MRLSGSYRPRGKPVPQPTAGEAAQLRLDDMIALNEAAKATLAAARRAAAGSAPDDQALAAPLSYALQALVRAAGYEAPHEGAVIAGLADALARVLVRSPNPAAAYDAFRARTVERHRAIGARAARPVAQQPAGGRR